MSCLFPVDMTNIMASAARCTGHTVDEARSLMVLGAQAALLAILPVVVLLVIWVLVRKR